jgi:hypothetical protein
MTGTAIAIATPPAAIEARTAAEAAQREGRGADANDAYRRELVALAEPAAAPTAAAAPRLTSTGAPLTIHSPLGHGPPAVVETLPAAEVDALFAIAGAWDGWNGAPAIAGLRRQWGGDTPANTAIAAAYGAADPELAALVGKYRLAGHPFVLEAAAMLGRRHLRGAARAADPPPHAAAASTEDAHEDALRLIRRQIVEAQSERDGARATRLYVREQELIRTRGGARPIVGGSGRTA